VGNASVVEGNGGTTIALFTVTLSVAGSQTVSVNYATADGTATAGSDQVISLCETGQTNRQGLVQVI
jgi:hypothetical protein